MMLQIPQSPSRSRGAVAELQLGFKGSGIKGVALSSCAPSRRALELTGFVLLLQTAQDGAPQTRQQPPATQAQADNGPHTDALQLQVCKGTNAQR